MTDEQRFTSYVEAGPPMADLLAVAGRLNASAVPMPVTTAYLLDMRDGSTYAQGAAHVLARAAAGQCPI